MDQTESNDSLTLYCAVLSLAPRRHMIAGRLRRVPEAVRGGDRRGDDRPMRVREMICVSASRRARADVVIIPSSTLL
jgi:hypothetical protein